MHSTATAELSDAGATREAFAHSKDTIARRRTNIRMVQNVLLIWLDNKIDENNEDCQNTITQLQDVVNTINTFTDAKECIEFINKMSDGKVCIIIEDSFEQQIVSRIHNMSQVDTVFIFSNNKKHHEQPIKEWYKIKGIFTEISSICDALKHAVHDCEHNITPISFIAINNDLSNKNLDQLDCSFMYTQIMKEILLNIQFDERHIKEFIQYCCDVFAYNKLQLIKIKELERKYHDKSPIWWYACESFLYPMLNRGLRVMDADTIIKMGFFIRDLHGQIEQLHREQFNDHHNGEIFTVYRGQGLLKTHFEQMSKTKGGLMSFNNFLSTSKDRHVSLAFAESNQINPDLMGILFAMTIDPSKSTTPFAYIKDVSEFTQEDEVLFSMHSIFRIDDIKSINENPRLFQVDLSLTSDNDKDLQVLTERIQEEMDADLKEWYRLGKLLLKIGQPDKAQQLYEVLLDQTTDDHEKALSYHYIGLAKYYKGEYEEALTFCEKAIEIKQQLLPSNHPDLAKSYNNIGLVYDSMGDYSKALSSHKKALESRQQLLPSNHSDVAQSYNNIGMVYYNMREYSKALPYYEKALEIDKISLPSNHPDLAFSYGNIGLLYDSMADYSKALSSYEKTLEIQQKTLPLDHPDLAKTYGNIGMMYENMGEYSKALSSHEKDLEISQQSLPSNHPDLAKTYGNIGNVCQNMGECSKALSSHEKALEIQQKSLLPNHLDLAKTYDNIGFVYYNMGEYSKALSYYEKNLEISQKSLSLNHPDLGGIYDDIGLVYENMGDYSKAYSFFERAVNIAQQSNHSNLEKWKSNLDRIKKKL